jgi:hypothetical protein
VALNSVRLVIGIGSLAMTTGLGAAMEHFHQITWLRVTLLVGALSGSTLTLGIVLRAIVTLLLVVVEEYLHFRLCHTL